MSELLKNHIRKFIHIDEDDLSVISTFFLRQTLKKKENVLVEGQICKYNYFIVKGCLRMFFLSEKGIEQTIDFAIENWWIADYFSFENKQKSEFNIQAVETSEVFSIDHQSQEAMLRQFPQMERYFKLIHQKAHSAAQYRIKYLYDLSREELYLHFRDKFPHFIQRIPQYLLASYLGFTPEYLSELRRKNI